MGAKTIYFKKIPMNQSRIVDCSICGRENIDACEEQCFFSTTNKRTPYRDSKLADVCSECAKRLENADFVFL